MINHLFNLIFQMKRWNSNLHLAQNHQHRMYDFQALNEHHHLYFTDENCFPRFPRWDPPKSHGYWGQWCWDETQIGLPLVPVFSVLLTKVAIALKETVVMGPGPGSFFVTPYIVLAFPLVDAIRCPMRISVVQEFLHSWKRNSLFTMS